MSNWDDAGFNENIYLGNRDTAIHAIISACSEATLMTGVPFGASYPTQYGSVLTVAPFFKRMDTFLTNVSTQFVDIDKFIADINDGTVETTSYVLPKLSLSKIMTKIGESRIQPNNLDKLFNAAWIIQTRKIFSYFSHIDAQVHISGSAGLRRITSNSTGQISYTNGSGGYTQESTGMSQADALVNNYIKALFNNTSISILASSGQGFGFSRDAEYLTSQFFDNRTNDLHLYQYGNIRVANAGKAYVDGVLAIKSRQSIDYWNPSDPSSPILTTVSRFISDGSFSGALDLMAEFSMDNSILSSYEGFNKWYVNQVYADRVYFAGRYHNDYIGK